MSLQDRATLDDVDTIPLNQAQVLPERMIRHDASRRRCNESEITCKYSQCQIFHV